MSTQAREMRLQKFIADCGLTSRRKAEDLIIQGRVKINGVVAATLGTKVDPEVDTVHVDEKVCDLSKIEKIYAVLNKPRGFVTTLNDPEGRQTVMDLIRDIPERVYPVGRLDYLSEGLLIMTNDGDLANRVMHPKHNVVKVYEVKVFGAVTHEILKKLRAGALVDNNFLKPLSVRVVGQLANKTWLEFRLGEGRNREIRKICEAHGLTVDKLRRVAIGGLTVDGIAPGKYRVLTKKKLESMLAQELKETGDKGPYVSSKKSINVKRKGTQKGAASADDGVFSMYRRETYFETIKKRDEIKKEIALKKREEELAEREASHQKRKYKKSKRVAQKKWATENSGPHAEFVKD